MNKQLMTTAGAMGLLLAVAPASHATIIGFGNSESSNAKVPANLGSNATVDAGGVTVSNGATPNIAVEFIGPDWDYHHSSFFDGIEGHTAGGTFDSDGGADIAQVENNGASIVFTADPGYALVLNSFDFGLSTETIGQGNTWDIELTDSSNAVVWSTNPTFLNSGAGDVQTFNADFTGNLGASYTLTFTMTSETDITGSPYGVQRNALDNVSFNQTDVPEPGSLALLGLGGLALLRRRR